MSTRSRIAVKLSKTVNFISSGNLKGQTVKAGNVIHVYCHNDGYPSDKIPTLLKYYNTEERMLELLKHGDMSSLHERTDGDRAHSFDSKVENQSVFYGRDRGETDIDAQVSTEEEWIENWAWEEFSYTFDNGKLIARTDWDKKYFEDSSDEVKFAKHFEWK